MLGKIDMKALKLFVLACVVALSGCATTKPYASVSAGYNLQETSAPERYDDRCNIPAGFEVGLEHKSGLSYGARHESNYDCGPYSWNPDRLEYWRDQVFIKYKFGGFK